MKMKRLLLVVSILAVMFSLAGCSENMPKPFDYNEDELALATMSSFDQYKNVSDDYADYYVNDGTEYEQSVVKGIKQAENNDKVGKFEDFGKYILGNEPVPKDMYKVVNSTDSVSVTVINKAENRDVEITVKYVENPDYYIQYDQIASGLTVEEFREELAAYGYDDEEQFLSGIGFSSAEEYVEYVKSNVGEQLKQNGTYPYIAEEMVVSAVYSKKELMASAGKNTLIGMGTVFVVLIFISFIISLFKYLPALFAKKPKIETEKKEAPKQPVAATKSVPTSSDDLMNDDELVAVITAAVYAAAGDSNGAVSKDKLVVRSIKRARK